MNSTIIKNVREKNPLIHHLINEVVMNFVANGTLSFGASPVMARSLKEASDMASNADGVLLNIGTVTEEDIPAMIAAGKTANDKNIPVLVDPVGVAATSFRSEAIQAILQDVKPTVIKGNAGEMAHLAGVSWEVKGVDSVGEGDVSDIVKRVAETYNTSVVISGKTDVIYSNNQLYTNDLGHPYLTKVTGGGCLLGSVITACLTTDAPVEEQLQTAVQFYGLAAEYTVNQLGITGPGTFMARFIDALSKDVETLTGDDV